MTRMVSCSPIVCCTRSVEPKQKDECMCGCGYLNGGLQIAAAQCLLILGTFFSVASLGDCSFVKIDEDLRFVLGPTKTSNTFGYLTFEDMFDGRCYWYDDGGATSQQQVEQYWDFLGQDFSLMRIFAMIGAGGGVLQFLYSVTFCCSSQVRSFRYLQFFLISIVLTLFQGLTLLIFNSDFCEEYNCTFGRSAGFSGASCACYFMAGAMYCAMSDYPGEEFNDRSNASTGDYSHNNQDEFHDEESDAGSLPSTSYPDSDEEAADITPRTSNVETDATDIEAPNVLEAPLASVPEADEVSAAPSAPGDDQTASSVTSIYVEDTNSETPSNDVSALGPPSIGEEEAEEQAPNKDPLAAAFKDSTNSAPEKPTAIPEEPAAISDERADTPESEVVVVEEEVVDENGEVIEEEVVEVQEEEEEVIEGEVDGEQVSEEEIIFEEVEDETEYEEEELNGGLPTVMEEGEPSESEEPPMSPIASAQPEEIDQAPTDAGEPLKAPQPPSESPTKEERIPMTAEEVADDSSDDPIFE